MDPLQSLKWALRAWELVYHKEETESACITIGQPFTHFVALFTQFSKGLSIIFTKFSIKISQLSPNIQEGPKSKWKLKKKTSLKFVN